MTTAAGSTKKHAILRRALTHGIKTPASRAVVSWVNDHLRLPDAQMRKMKRLYDKLMAESITADERVELDSLMDACAVMDILRARLIIGEGK